MPQKIPGLKQFQGAILRVIKNLDILEKGKPLLLTDEGEDTITLNRIDTNVISLEYHLPEKVKVIVFTGLKEWIAIEFDWDGETEVLATLTEDYSNIYSWSADRMADIVDFTALWAKEIRNVDWKIVQK